MDDAGRVSVAGAGIDGAPSVRPGVPRERRAPDQGAHWNRPEQQHDLTPLARSGLLHATPVFGTVAPPRALSGAVRRLAYRVPEHRATRWALLLAGDKLDVLEHRLAAGVWLLPVAVALVAGYVGVSRALRR